MLKLSAAALVAAVVYSELAFRSERATKPVDGDKSILAHKVWTTSKGKASKKLIVFVHGWPDDLNMWTSLAAKLSENHYCVSCNLPGYPLPPHFDGDTGNMPIRKWGYGLDEAVVALKSTIDNIVREGDFTSVTLVTHDWGAVIGYLFDQTYPNFVNRMISIDVGWRLGGPTVYGLLYTVLYQSFLNLCFMLPSPVGTYLTRMLASVLGRAASSNAGPVTSAMNWPYRAAFRDMATKGALTRMDSYKITPIPRLFLFARETHDSMRFSDDKWTSCIEKSVEGISKSEALKGGHWMLIKNEAQVIKIIENWLGVAPDGK